MRIGKMRKVRIGSRKVAAKTTVLNVAREKDCPMFKHVEICVLLSSS